MKKIYLCIATLCILFIHSHLLAKNLNVSAAAIAVTSSGSYRVSSAVDTAPIATTNDASNVLSFGATLNAVVNPGNLSTAVGFEYGPTGAYGSWADAVPSPVAGSSEVPVSSAITGLAPNTTYHYRVVATSSSGTSNGQDVAFTTQPEPVTDISLSASSVAENQPSGTVVGTLSTTLAPPCTYSLVAGAGGSDNASFGLGGGALALDQDAGAGNSAIGIFPGYGDIWQSFTAGASGQLGRIMLKPAQVGRESFTMKLKVFDGEGISGAFLGESTAALVILGNGYIAWDFSGVTVTQGNKYTFQLADWTFSDGSGFYAWTDGTHYAGGQLNHGGYPGCELVFKTYMAGTTDLVTASTFDYEAKSAYNIRVRAANAASYVEKEFTIHVTGQPTATTGSASNTSAASATLNAVVNPGNLSTAVGFEYGPTGAYGSWADAVPSPVAGSSEVPVSSAITGLAPNTTYHYRVVATSSSGTSNGQDVAFTTQPEPVTDISLSASSVAENQPSGAVVGALSTTLAPPCTYSLVGGAGGSDNASFGLRGGNLALDQDSGLGDTGLAFYSGAGDIWQSFTAGASGQLGRIMLRAVGAPMAGHPMKLRVFDGEGISGAFLGESTATIPPDLLVAWDFSGITLAQGNKYTFQMVEWTFPDFYGFCGWTDDTHYAGGKLNHGGYPGCELGFKTYMAGTTDLVTASTFDYEAKSAYHIRVRAANAASYVEKEFTIHVTGVRDTVTAITSSELETELIYPNPAINGCFINVETNGLLAIYDMRACLVLKKILNNREYVDLTSLAKGVYLVKVNGRTAKLIKK